MRYTRLKLKMLLLVVLGTVIAMAVGVIFVNVVIEGLLQGAFTRFFLWGAEEVFGKTHDEAAALYQLYIRGNRQQILTAGLVVLMLVAFYLAMGRFTTWLDQIRVATRQIVSESSEDVRLPKELAPMEADLRLIQNQLRAREAEARESETRKQDLIAFLAHDLKTPLTSVVGYLTLLHNEPDLEGEQRAKYTGVALDKAQRLEELLGEFFDITRMDLKIAKEDMAPVLLTMLLEQLSDEFYPIFAGKELTCETRLEPRLVVLGEGARLARVFDNILRNAVSYSTPGGTELLRGERAGDRVVVTVTNEGLEIPEKELGRIFEKFYRLDAARSSRTGGVGLGLAIAKEIVELHGGAIRAESNGKTTSFVISLPEYTLR